MEEYNPENPEDKEAYIKKARGELEELANYGETQMNLVKALAEKTIDVTPALTTELLFKRNPELAMKFIFQPDFREDLYLTINMSILLGYKLAKEGFEPPPEIPKAFLDMDKP